MCIIPQHAKERKKKHEKDRKNFKKNTLFQWIMLLTIYVKCQTPEFKIIYINKPEEMEMAHNLIDRNKDTFFKL